MSAGGAQAWGKVEAQQAIEEEEQAIDEEEQVTKLIGPQCILRPATKLRKTEFEKWEFFRGNVVDCFVYILASNCL